VAPIIIFVFGNYFHILLCLVKLQFTSFLKKLVTHDYLKISCVISRLSFMVYMCLRMAVLWLVLIRLKKETGSESLSSVI
jgi:hypothetical protein